MSRPQVLLVPDLHCPWQDDDAIREVARWAAKHQPRQVIFLGDVVDAYSLSRFGKKLETASLSVIREERKCASAVLSKLSSHSAVRPLWLAGNHEERFAKRLGETPFVAPYTADPFASLAAEVGVEYEPRGMRRNDTILLMHGLTSGAYGGAAALAQSRRRGLSVAQGHSHRAGLIVHAPDRWAMECGHLADPKAPCFEYEPGARLGLSGWQTAFAWLDDKWRPRLEVL